MKQNTPREKGLAALEAAGVLGALSRLPGTPSRLPGTVTQWDVGPGEGGDESSGAPFGVDGHSLGGCPVVSPEDGEALARSVAILAEHGMAALVRGGGSRLEIGNPPGPIDVVLEMRGLSGVTDFERDDGVVHAKAGTPLLALREEVEAEGWTLRLDPASALSTVGGTLAAGGVGPRVLGFGRPRDCVLGLDVVLGSGELTSCGGRVVKNVTGYDMAKLYTGSFGTLGVITAAWLRLAPIPELKQTLIATSSNFENMFAIALEASRRSTAQAAALLSPIAGQRAGVSSADTSSQWVLVLELAGDEAATRCDADWLKDRKESSIVECCDSVASAPAVEQTESDPSREPELGSRNGGQADAIDRVRALQGGTLEPGGTRIRIAALPSALGPIAGAVADRCTALILHPGVGLAYAFSTGGRDAGIDAIDACTHAAASAGGSVVLEALPAAAKVGRDVFGEFGPELALMRALKQRFDPAAVLNPRRFAGRI